MNDTPYITLWFKLTNEQRRKINSLGYGPTHFLMNITMDEFKTVTKSKKLINDLIVMKRSCLRLVA